MKLNEIRCDLCEKNKKFFKSESNYECDSGNAATSNEAVNTSGDQGKCQQQQSAVVAKCLDCNFFLCASCLLDHQFISSFANHQLVAFSTLLNKEDQDTNDSFRFYSIILNKDLKFGLFINEFVSNTVNKIN